MAEQHDLRMAAIGDNGAMTDISYHDPSRHFNIISRKIFLIFGLTAHERTWYHNNPRHTIAIGRGAVSLNSVRISRGMSVRALAAKVCVPKSTVSEWETIKPYYPVSFHSKLSAALHVAEQDLAASMMDDDWDCQPVDFWPFDQDAEARRLVRAVKDFVAYNALDAGAVHAIAANLDVPITMAELIELVKLSGGGPFTIAGFWLPRDVSGRLGDADCKG